MFSKRRKNFKNGKNNKKLGRKRKNPINANIGDTLKNKDLSEKKDEKGNSQKIEKIQYSSIKGEKDKSKRTKFTKLKKELEAKNSKKIEEICPEKEIEKGIFNSKNDEIKCSKEKIITENNERKLNDIIARDIPPNSQEKKFPKEIDEINKNKRSSNADKKFEESEFSSSIKPESNSISEIQSKNNNKENLFIIKGINQTIVKEISLDDMKKLLKNKEYEALQNYSFPYISQSEFNQKIYPTNKDEFNSLFFYCPVCNINLRHFSMPYHIFQFHFKFIKGYLSQRDIALGCAKLMELEFIKVKSSLEFFSELAVLFTKCEFTGASYWRRNAKSQINELKNLNIKEYFNKTEEQVIKELQKKLPVNINRNKKRNYKPLKAKNCFKKYE